MTLPIGAISIGQINTEFGYPTNTSLRSVSYDVGLIQPDSFSEFHGMSNILITALQNPGSPLTHNLTYTFTLSYTCLISRTHQIKWRISTSTDLAYQVGTVSSFSFLSGTHPIQNFVNITLDDYPDKYGPGAYLTCGLNADDEIMMSGSTFTIN